MTKVFGLTTNVQPFANTLVNMDLTGAQIKQALEQQWQPSGASRPFLRLGTSKGFTYTYDASKPAGSRITHMWLNGDRIEPGEVFSVTVNSFLAAGGDNFRERDVAARHGDRPHREVPDHLQPVQRDREGHAVGLDHRGGQVEREAELGEVLVLADQAG